VNLFENFRAEGTALANPIFQNPKEVVCLTSRKKMSGPAECYHVGKKSRPMNHIACIACGEVLKDHPPVPNNPWLLRQDYNEVMFQRYCGLLSGEPEEHMLGSSPERSFEGTPYQEIWERVRDVVEGQRLIREGWQDAFYCIGTIAAYLSLPKVVREDIARAYANLRKTKIAQKSGVRQERLLGYLTYVACKIHRFPRSFDSIKEAFEELYGVKLQKKISNEVVQAFNYGHIRFGIEETETGQRYLRTWQMIGGERFNHRSLGPL
jgi:hypothetical protein